MCIFLKHYTLYYIYVLQCVRQEWGTLTTVYLKWTRSGGFELSTNRTWCQEYGRPTFSQKVWLVLVALFRWTVISYFIGVKQLGQREKNLNYLSEQLNGYIETAFGIGIEYCALALALALWEILLGKVIDRVEIMTKNWMEP